MVRAGITSSNQKKHLTNCKREAARAMIAPTYEKLVDRANAPAELKMASAELQVFIRALNQRIKSYKETPAFHWSKSHHGF